MMKRLMIKTICLLCLPKFSLAMTIQYFGLNNQQPINQTKNVDVCLLDNTQRIKDIINDDFKKQMSANQISISDIHSHYENQFKALSKNVICQYKAAKLGVVYLPAIVINRQYVIYGQQNINSAIQEYQAYLERDHVD